MPPDRLVTQVRSDTLKRMYVTRGLGKKYGPTPGCPGCATVGSHHQASHSGTCRDRMRAELEKSEDGRECLAREQARVDARKQEQPSSSTHKRAVSEEWDHPPEKFWRMGEEDVTMRQDITATSGASSSSASRGSAMDIESRPSRKRAADVQTEDLEDNEQLDANESAASLPQAEGESSDGRMFIGNWEHIESETHNHRLGDKVAGDGYLGLDESMDITTVNEQGVQWDFTDVEMRNEAFRKTVAEKPFLLMGAHPCASWRSKSNASWSRMTQKDDELHRARVHWQFVCRMYKLQHDEGRYFLHEHFQSELPWRKDCVEEIQEMTGAKLMSVRRGNNNLPSNEKPTVMVTNCPGLAFTLRVSAKDRFLNKRYSEHLERNEHKSNKDLHEDISCGTRLQHKWSRQHKYFLASVDVKNPQSVLPEESNDELLDQAWDDHTGESLDAKKVKEARQLEMEYYDKMHVFDKVPIAQCWERDWQGAPESKMGRH